MTKKGMVFKSFCSWDDSALVINILLKPSEKRDAIEAVIGTQLKVSVTASPVAGKATDHMIQFLAEEFGVETRAIDVTFGRTNANKQLRIQSPKRFPAVIANHLTEKMVI